VQVEEGAVVALGGTDRVFFLEFYGNGIRLRSPPSLG